MAKELAQFDQVRISSAATTNEQLVRPGKCAIGALMASNSGGAAAFVKIYDKASAPNLAADVPIYTLTVPAGGNASMPTHEAVQMELGLAIAITNLVADNDTTAVAAAQVKVLGAVGAQ